LEGLDLFASGRAEQNWKPLQAIAEALEDNEWLEYSRKQMKSEIGTLIAGQSYEPQDAILITLGQLMVKGNIDQEDIAPKSPASDVFISDIKSELRNQFDISLISRQIQEICTQLGFAVVTTHNYPKVIANPELLEELLKEKELLNLLKE